MSNECHTIERSVLIHASTEIVFSYFSDSARFAAWWGEGSSIEARIGGRVHIRYPNGIVAGGEVQKIEPGRSIRFSFGYESGDPMPLGSTEVTIRLEAEDEGTRVSLRHVFGDEALRDAHVAGWRYHLAVFARVAAALQHGDFEARAEEWFSAWNESDAARCLELLTACATEELRFRDDFGCTAGREELAAHIAAVRQHAPGLLKPEAAPLRNHGTALIEFAIERPDGGVASGVNVFRLAPDGRIREVVGITRS